MPNGWTGKILRVNLTSGKITTEDSSKYAQKFIGGIGFGQVVMAEEVPLGTKPFDEANKLVFTVGPLTGAGAPCSSRSNITSLSTFTKGNLVVDAHMGGYFPAEMKYAGYDAIIIEGRSSKPVWLHIQDDQINIEPADFIWGKGTRETTEEICKLTSSDTCVASIGPAGEKLVPLSCIMNSRCHSGGAGTGAVMGSKNLKAIAVKGTHGVRVADRKELMRLNKYMETQLIGSNNNHVVPSTPQAWAEFYASGSRWTARKGLFWAAAEGGPIETGEIPPGDQCTVGYRTMKSVWDMGPGAEKYTVKMSGCQSCPIRCMSQLRVPQAKKYGVSETGGNTCVPNYIHANIYPHKDEHIKNDEDWRVLVNLVGLELYDDYGLWYSYEQTHNDFIFCYKHDIFKRVLPKEEYDSIPWHLLEAGDPEFLVDIYRRFAHKEGKISEMCNGSLYLMEHWDLGPEYLQSAKTKLVSPLGWAVHHANEAGGQVGGLINMMYNRDPMCHSHINFILSGMPLSVKKEVAAELFGSPDAYDDTKKYTPINPYKIKYVKWSLVKLTLHNCLTLCNWNWPMTLSPLKSRNYRGDLTIESKFYNAVTGLAEDEASLDFAAERVFQLHRAETVRRMGTMDMRHEHDILSPWVYDRDPDLPAFAPGTDKLDREDMQKALTMFYEEMGWDPVLGCPTRATLLRFGLNDEVQALDVEGLLPDSQKNQMKAA